MYDSSTKGSDGMTKLERFAQLDGLLAEQDGMLQTSQAVARGIVKPIFYEYIKERKLEQVAHGIYVSEDTWIDAMFLLHLRCGQAVFSHESALFFHDLTDREPSPYAITVRRGYSTTRLKAEGLSVYTIKPELFDVGVSSGQTPFGHTVPVYDMERTICDLLRSRSRIEIQTFQGALKAYARRKDKNLRALMQYAGMFKVEKILRQYLEVLL
jgi:predicted transcriptional regulator of viral defense system